MTTTAAPTAVAHQVYQILSRHSGLSPAEITADTSLEAAGIDSLDMVEILYDLEDVFDVKIPDTGDATDRFRQFLTAGSTVQLIEALVARKAAA